MLKCAPQTRQIVTTVEQRSMYQKLFSTMAKNLPFSYSRKLYWSTSSCDDALMESVPGQRSDWKLHVPVGGKYLFGCTFAPGGKTKSGRYWKEKRRGRRAIATSIIRESLSELQAGEKQSFLQPKVGTCRYTSGTCTLPCLT